MAESQLSVATATYNNMTISVIPLSGLLSDEVRIICQWIFFTVICQIIDLFGIATNIVNIVCFVRQGFKDPVNISLLGLAIADLGCLITLVWTNIWYTPAFSDCDLPFDPIEFLYLTSGMPHTTFTRITGWITAVITLERCLCITMPLRVRRIVTSRRVLIIIVVIFVVLLASVSPLYVVNKLGMKFYPDKNRTVLGLVLTDNREGVEQISLRINNVFIPFSSFIIVNICTVILVIKLKKRTAWRDKTTSSIQADAVSSRNQKAAKMVVMISTLFIACYVPASLVFTGMVLEPELAINRRYKNSLIVVAGISFILESVNSSVNIFIYYHMSTKYRAIFRQLFRMSPDRSSPSDDC